MSIDPRTIRAEPHLEIGALIRREAGLLIDRWQRRAVQEQPDARRAHEETLRDHLPRFLEDLGRILAEAGDPENTAHCMPAREHGEQRWEAGWSLSEVVRDYQILRLVLIDYLDEALDRPLQPEEIKAIGLALDEAIAASVSRFVQSEEQHVRRLEALHAEEARRTTAALQESQRNKDQFLAVLAHELRNFLAPTVNVVETLRLIPNADPTLLQLRDIADRQVKQMVRLVDDLLDITRIAQGRFELRKSAVDCVQVAQRAMQTSAPQIETRGHRLAVALPAEALWVEADSARLVQVLANLLNNAAKYTPPGGDIELSAAREDEVVVLRVRDTGVGIPAEQLDQVFEPFKQLEQSAGGLGIGLALARRLVELHGGSITARSEGPGQGSEFIIRLPALAQAPDNVAPPTESAPPAAPSRRVLIVEDNPDGRESLKTLLERCGHRVEAAADGPEGVAMALASAPDIALIDLGLPGLDGCEVAQAIRAKLGDRVYLVALTGFGQDEDRRRSHEAGFDAHLVKPVLWEDLAQLLVSVSPSSPP